VYFGLNNSANPSVPLNNNGLSRKHILEGFRLSLERLDLPYVDIVYAHRPDRNTAVEEVVRAFNYLISIGKVYYWGTSEWSASEIANAWRVADRLGLIGPVVEQPQYNLLVRNKVEDEFRWLYEKYHLGLTVYSPLKQGILSGKYNGQDVPPPESRLSQAKDKYSTAYKKTFGDATWKEELAQVEKLKPIAGRLGTTLAQLALAWVLKNPNVTSVITGASRPEQIEENVKALALSKRLTQDTLQEIDDVLGNSIALPPRRF
jgi:aryl-alcohol dehydrogenase-like predicted oxidoreductase